MRKRIYISADYSVGTGDRDVVNILHQWSENASYKVDFVDTAEVISGSVSQNPDCRACDLKSEFNRQINVSSAVIFIVGDKTASRIAGSNCDRVDHDYSHSFCTPYKQNTNGVKNCKHVVTKKAPQEGDVGEINKYSYIQHEFEQAKRKNKVIVILYNSLRKEEQWLPSYMKDDRLIAEPFWIRDDSGNKIGNYEFVKKL